jgi:hypothetical protein
MGSAERPRDFYNERDQEVTDNIPYPAILKAVVEVVQRANFLGPVESNNGFTQNGIPIGGGGGSAHVIEDEGTPLTARANLNFVGAGVTVTDSSPDTVVTIPGAPVTSVNGATGAVSLDSDDVAEGATNLYNKTHTGDATGATALTIANDVVSNAKLANMVAGRIKGRISTDGDPQDLTAAEVRTLLNVADGANAYVHPNHSGDVTSVADGAQTIAAAAVSNAKMANMVTKTLKGRNTGSTGAPEDITVLQVQQWRQTSEASNATPSINSDNVGRHSITALAAAITSLTVTGTPYDGQLLWISLLDNGTARAIAFGATVENSTVTMPTTTVISTPLDMLFRWNSVTSKWRLISKA